jgi:RimJ/RimL family protein N-acetyltransferase
VIGGDFRDKQNIITPFFHFKSILQNIMEITQRIANFNDAALLLKWRNDPDVQRYSIHSEEIQVEDHEVWLARRLKRIQLEPFFVFHVDDEAVGMTRLDLLPGSRGEYEISIMVEPEKNNMGIGTRILESTCETFFNLQLGISLVAQIHMKNIISQKLFENAEFRRDDIQGEFLRYRRILKESL